MGWMTLLAPCFGCKNLTTFNPNRCPSIRVNGKKEPVCRSCVERANPKRIANGLAPIVIHPEAYEPEPEGGI